MKNGFLAYNWTTIEELFFLMEIFVKHEKYQQFFLLKADYNNLMRLSSDKEDSEIHRVLNVARNIEDASDYSLDLWCVIDCVRIYVDVSHILSLIKSLQTQIKETYFISCIPHNIRYCSQSHSHSKVVREEFLRIKANNEKLYEVIEKLVQESIVRVRNYIVPLSIYDTMKKPRQDFQLCWRIKEFGDWIQSRVLDYFSTRELHVFSGQRRLLLTETDLIVMDIVENFSDTEDKLYLEKKFVNYNAVDFNSVLFALKYSNNMKVRLVDSYEELTEVDMLLDNILNFHMPYLSEFASKEKTFQNDYNTKRQFDDLAELVIYTQQKQVESSILKRKVCKLQNNDSIYYYVAGKKHNECIYIVTAYGVEVDVWQPLVFFLQERYYVIIGELRGVKGERTLANNAKNFGVSDHVDDINEILLHEGISKLHIVSWCSGAKQAIFFCHKHKTKIKSNIILCGEYAPYCGSKSAHSKFRQSVQEIYDIVKDNDRVFEFYMKIINQSIFSTSIYYDELLDKCAALKENNVLSLIFKIVPENDRQIILGAFSSKEKMRSFLSMCVEYYKHDVENVIRELNVQTLIFGSERDQIASPKQSEWADSKFSSSHLFILPEATHNMVKERSLDLFLYIDEHVNSLSSRMT